jgi:hypothetical protein
MGSALSQNLLQGLTIGLGGVSVDIHILKSIMFVLLHFCLSLHCCAEDYLLLYNCVLYIIEFETGILIKLTKPFIGFSFNNIFYWDIQ